MKKGRAIVTRVSVRLTDQCDDGLLGAAVASTLHEPTCAPDCSGERDF
jgi:hypothetical protein